MMTNSLTVPKPPKKVWAIMLKNSYTDGHRNFPSIKPIAFYRDSKKASLRINELDREFQKNKTPFDQFNIYFLEEVELN